MRHRALVFVNLRRHKLRALIGVAGIGFGVRGSEMAGREYLTDADVAALAAYVQSLRVAP